MPTAITPTQRATGKSIILIEGGKLVELIIEYNVGVSVSDIYGIKQIDTDYFEQRLQLCRGMGMVFEDIKAGGDVVIGNMIVVKGDYTNGDKNVYVQLGTQLEESKINTNMGVGELELENRTDVIAIGAINYDFILVATDTEKASGADAGKEEFVEKTERKEKDFIKSVKKLCDNEKRVRNIQLGGSALIALKTVKAAYPSYRLGYVGVKGTVARGDMPFPLGYLPNMEAELGFLDDKNSPWLFQSGGRPGCALVLLDPVGNTRNRIKIASGVNKELWEKLIGEGRERFIQYLRKSKWIHISSLREYCHFKQVVDCAVEARNLEGSSLFVSIDPGYNLLENHRAGIEKIAKVVDYVFLNKLEALKFAELFDVHIQDDETVLKAAIASKLGTETVAIFKQEGEDSLIGGCFSGEQKWRDFNFEQLVVRHEDIRNDTGAGDAMAGGFIAGMLSKENLALEERLKYADGLGRVASRARLLEFGDPFPSIAEACKEYIDNDGAIIVPPTIYKGLLAADLCIDSSIVKSFDTPSHKHNLESLPTSTELPNGYYRIQHRGSGKYVSAGETLDASVYISDWSGGNHQKFGFERQSDSSYRIYPLYENGKDSLDVEANGLSEGIRVIHWGETGGDNQRWRVVDCENGYYKLIAKHSGLCLDVCGGNSDNGTILHQWSDNGTDAQRFKIEPTTLSSNEHLSRKGNLLDGSAMQSERTTESSFKQKIVFFSAVIGIPAATITILVFIFQFTTCSSISDIMIPNESTPLAGSSSEATDRDKTTEDSVSDELVIEEQLVPLRGAVDYYDLPIVVSVSNIQFNQGAYAVSGKITINNSPQPGLEFKEAPQGWEGILIIDGQSYKVIIKELDRSRVVVRIEEIPDGQSGK
jgi:sugar/nucleoside kinase (ribokinase family)